MSYSEEVKQLAYKLDEECWGTFLGYTKEYRREMCKRRGLSLEAAERYLNDKELMRAIHSAEEVFKEMLAPKKPLLHGKELKVGDAVVYAGDTFNVERFAHDGTVEIKRGGLEVYIPQDNVGRCLSWPKEASDKPAELRHYYETVITEMCKGTMVEPWECVRVTLVNGTKVPYAAAPDFTEYDPCFYEFAVTVHLNRPVWVGSVLYVKEGLENFTWPPGEECRVVGFTEGGKLKLVVPRLKYERAVSNYWRNWAVWEKPVKQKVPTRVRVGVGVGVGYSHEHYVTVPDALVKSEHIVRSFFATSKDADEFYEIFKNLADEKKA